MYQNKTFMAIVPARAGSKGLPGKNIKELCGKPLIAWSIESGLNSQYIDEVMVTTDGLDIAEIAKQYGASVPFLRPTELATDEAASCDVIEHVVSYYMDCHKKKFDYIVLLEPTSPLRTHQDIDCSIIQLLAHESATAIVGVCKTESQNPAFLISKTSHGFLCGYENTNMKVVRRQDIKDVFFFEGSVYVSETKEFMKKKTFYHGKTIGYEVPRWKSHEVDDIDDFITVEALMKFKEYNKSA